MARQSEESKARDREKARLRHAAFRASPDYQVWLDRTREQRRAYKAERRRKAGALPAGEWRALVSAEAAARKAKKGAASALHDAHVRRWRGTCKAAWFAHRYRTDAEFNAKQKLRARLRKLEADGELAAYLSNNLKKGGMLKRWQAMLGYTTRQLVAHLRRTLPKGATWDDFLAGRLHIDHILPRSSFDMTDPAEVISCWSLANLRLLWAEDNLRKSDRIEVLL